MICMIITVFVLRDRNDLMAQIDTASKYKNTIKPLVWLVSSAKKRHVNSTTQHQYHAKSMM